MKFFRPILCLVVIMPHSVSEYFTTARKIVRCGGAKSLRMFSSDSYSPTMENIVNLCKKKGFVFQSSEIYSPLAGFYDYGPLGVELKNNIKRLWWRDMVQRREDIVGLDCSIVSSASVWKASGHVGGFSDPMVDCKISKLRFRADQVFWSAVCDVEGNVLTYVSVLESENMEQEAINKALKKAKSLGYIGQLRSLQLKDLTKAPLEIYHLIPSPSTGEQGHLTLPRDFNLMFQTNVGAIESETSTAYLRPETAQGIFTNFLAVQRTERKKIPFGIAQIGKAFRNEITPRNFIFRSREFEQMEIEYFIQPEETIWKNIYLDWIDVYWQWLLSLGIREELLGREEHKDNDLAHYAKACTDITFRYPFGTHELMGIAARGNFDLTQHSIHSGKKLEYTDAANNIKYIPHVIEPSIGVDRLFLALITSAYREETVGSEQRVYLSLHPSIAPIKAVVLPLVSNKEDIVTLARTIFKNLQQIFFVEYDASGAIGRRYRRADECGTPFCITVDFDSVVDDTVTIRYRDTMMQERVKLVDLIPIISSKIHELKI